MRITNSMLMNNMLRNLGSNLQRLDKYQQQLATGKKVQKPSDDPIVAAKSLKLRTDVSQINQFKKNTDDALSWMEITESTLTQVQDVLQRARELAVQASTSTLTNEETIKISTEIKQLREELIKLGNSTYAGRYIFSGYSTDEKLLNSDGSFAIDVGQSEDIYFEVGISDRININILGGELFNGGLAATKGSTGKLIKHMDEFIDALDTGNFGNIQQSIDDISEDLDTVTKLRADIGARVNRIELTASRLEDDVVNFTQLLSQNEDADIAEVIMNLVNEENVYRSSLAGGARIIQPSLVDFLS